MDSSSISTMQTMESMDIEELRKLYLAEQQARQEAQQRAEEAEQQRQLEKQRAEEAEQQRQLEKQRAEEAEQQRQLEKQRAEEAEHQQQLEKQRAEEAEHQRQLEKQRAEKAEQGRQRTSLNEYLDLCYSCLFETFEVQQDQSFTTKGYWTNPRGKRCPTKLVPWSDFLEVQKETLGRLHTAYPKESRDFDSSDFLHTLGEKMQGKKVGSERDLEGFLHRAVEEPVAAILNHLPVIDGTSNHFETARTISFENHLNAISESGEETEERRQSQEQDRPTASTLNAIELKADQICVSVEDKDASGGRKLAFIIEYKAPHKLTLPHLRFGLREMDIFTEVVHRVTKPPAEETEALFQYHSDRLAAAAVTQTFHYMIEGGLEYSYLTTGEGIVFLKLDWTDPTTLYFHLAEPREEVQANPENSLHCTPISQVAAFSLLALGSHAHRQSERQEAMSTLNVWEEDCETILKQIPETQRKQTPPPSAFKPRNYHGVDRTPLRPTRPVAPLRPRLARKAKASETCHPDFLSSFQRHSSESSDDGPLLQDTPLAFRTRGRTAPSSAPQKSQKDSTASSKDTKSSKTHAYCTQKCLLGLIRSEPLDPRCPNVSLHRQGRRKGSQYHLLNHRMWLTLVRNQLARSLDDDLDPLRKGGARGVLFRVTLSSHGYTFVAKGTVPTFREDLRHEAAIYQQLRPLQGECVPVYLGAIDLDHPYYYDVGVRVVHMMFLSWAGETLNDGNATEDMKRDWNRELGRSVQAIHDAGVLHGDIRPANTLWSPDVGRMMVIDFDRSIDIRPPRHPLSTQSPNRKRRRLSIKVNVDVKRNAAIQNMLWDRQFMRRLEIALTERGIF